MNLKIPYECFPKFVLRTPLFHYSYINRLLENSDTPEESIKDLCKNKIVQEAIFLASPDLHKEMIKWINNQINDKKRSENLFYSLTQYLIRMSSRCTPFGLFAGFSVGEWNDHTKIILDEISNNKRHTRFDMNYLCALAIDLAKIPDVKNNIKFYPNSSIYKSGEKLRYVEYKYKNARRSHHIVSVDYSDYLQNILEAASEGAYLKDLAQIIVNEEVSYEESLNFINELSDNQLLIPDLEPAITGQEFLEQMLDIIQGIENIDNYKNILKKVKDILKNIDGSPIGETVHYYTIMDEFKRIDTKFDIKYLFQTDLVKKTLNCTLDRSMLAEIFEGFDILNKLTIYPSKNNLTLFKESFFERYENREIPLLQVLDTESGIGYIQNVTGDINPLVEDIGIQTNKVSNEMSWNQINSFMFGKYRESLLYDRFEIEFLESELKSFKSIWDDLPLTLPAMIRIIDEKSGNDIKRKIIFSNFGGSSAANLLGRFCHSDELTYSFVKEITEKERELNPDAVFAEIIHLPESRIGNILLRPVLREYEIPYLAKPSVGSEYQIRLQDLMVSIKAGRIFLRSKRLNKEIIPRLSSAHNFNFNSLPVYHFLCDLQVQNMRAGVAFNWGPLISEYMFRPRVTYKNLIFSPATWIIKKTDIKDIIALKDDEKLISSMTEWRKKNKIPSKILLVEGDNELLLNLDNLLCIKTMFSIIKNRPFFELYESFYNPENNLVQSKEGAFNNQFIIAFYKNQGTFQPEIIIK